MGSPSAILAARHPGRVRAGLRVLLIKPRWWLKRFGGMLIDFSSVPPLHLGIVAALTPADCEVRIVDEDVEDIPFEPGWDLVGITATTCTSRAAYEISERFRRLGSQTVLGGVHPSIVPEDGSPHADAVVVGEAESTWPQLLEDFRRGRMRARYVSAGPVPPGRIPFPRRDLFQDRYWFDAIQVSRGCDRGCSFCYNRDVPWGQPRVRPIAAARAELASTRRRGVFIVDDNLFVDRGYALGFFRSIAPLKRKLYIQAPSRIAQDGELLAAMAAAGVFMVMVGFQATDQRVLDEAGVTHGRACELGEAVAAFHRHGLGVLGFFMFGFDGQDRSAFSSTAAAIEATGLDAFFLYLLTPYPGTRALRELDRQGRLLTRDFSKYSWNNPVFRPKQMTPEELKDGLVRTYRRINSHMRRTLLSRAGFVLKNYWRHPFFGLALLSLAVKGIDVDRMR